MRAAPAVEVHQDGAWPDERDTAAVAYWLKACFEDDGASSITEVSFADSKRRGPNPKHAITQKHKDQLGLSP